MRIPRDQAAAMMTEVAVNEFKEYSPGRVITSHRSMDRPINVYSDVMPGTRKIEGEKSEYG